VTVTSGLQLTKKLLKHTLLKVNHVEFLDELYAVRNYGVLGLSLSKLVGCNTVII